MSMENILELQQVSKTFPKSNFTLENVTFSLPYGAILGFVGENGAGKTTTIGCILNTITKDSGTVKLFGQEMLDADTSLREKIGVVYDGDNFPAYWTAKQLSKVMEGLYTQWDNSLFQKYLEDFHLSAKQKIKHYSRGMTMKLAIAAALAHHPELLILDEATSGLDPIMRDEMLDVFLEFVQEENHSILLSSHITSDLEKVADYITFIHNGKLIMTVSKNDLVYNYAVMRCKESQFLTLDPKDILAYRKRDFQIDVLVSNAKVFAAIMLLLGIFVVAMDNKIPSLIIGYMLLAMIGFSLNSIASLRKESATKWSKYKLTTPVKRSAIVQSYFLSLLLWLIVGMVFAGIGVALSIMLHGFPFDKDTDVFMLFVIGVGISLFMGAIFFPLFYVGGEERNEVFLVISLLCGIGFVMGLTTLINTLFPAPMTTMQIILGGVIIFACALLVFVISCPVTAYVYHKREY